MPMNTDLRRDLKNAIERSNRLLSLAYADYAKSVGLAPRLWSLADRHVVQLGGRGSSKANAMKVARQYAVQLQRLKAELEALLAPKK